MNEETIVATERRVLVRYYCAEQAGGVKAEIWLTESDDGTIRIFAV